MALTDIARTLILPDRRILVGQPQQTHVKVFDGAGRFLHRIGTLGQGPGELQLLANFGLVPGSSERIWIADVRQGRHEIYSVTGEHIETRSVRPIELPGGVVISEPGFLLAEGKRLSPGGLNTSAIARGIQTENSWFVVHADGTVEGPAVVQDVSGRYVLVRDPAHESRVLTIRSPFRKFGHVFGWRGGEGFIHVFEEAPEESPGSRCLRLTAFDTHGDTLWTRSFAVPGPPLDNRTIDEWVRSVAEPMGEGSRLGPAIREALPDRLFAPLVRSVLGGSDGVVWLELTGEAGDPGGSQWWAIASDGSAAVRVAVPTGVQIADSRGTFLVGRQSGPFDVPQLVLLSLVREDPGPRR